MESSEKISQKPAKPSKSNDDERSRSSEGFKLRVEGWGTLEIKGVFTVLICAFVILILSFNGIITPTS